MDSRFYFDFILVEIKELSTILVVPGGFMFSTLRRYKSKILIWELYSFSWIASSDGDFNMDDMHDIQLFQRYINYQFVSYTIQSTSSGCLTMEILSDWTHKNNLKIKKSIEITLVRCEVTTFKMAVRGSICDRQKRVSNPQKNNKRDVYNEITSRILWYGIFLSCLVGKLSNIGNRIEDISLLESDTDC